MCTSKITAHFLQWHHETKLMQGQIQALREKVRPILWEYWASLAYRGYVRFKQHTHHFAQHLQRCSLDFVSSVYVLHVMAGRGKKWPGSVTLSSCVRGSVKPVSQKNWEQILHRACHAGIKIWCSISCVVTVQICAYTLCNLEFRTDKWLNPVLSCSHFEQDFGMNTPAYIYI